VEVDLLDVLVAQGDLVLAGREAGHGRHREVREDAALAEHRQDAVVGPEAGRVLRCDQVDPHASLLCPGASLCPCWRGGVRESSAKAAAARPAVVACRRGGAPMDAVVASNLHELEAIKRLKYRYLRCLDQKRWDELADCFTVDARSSYGGGRYAHEGREAIVAFLRKAMGAPSFLSSHRAHHPEIDFTGPDTATGVWAL